MNKSTTTPTVSPLLASYLYRFNLSLAEMKERRAQEAESYGQVGCAKLLRFQRDQYLAEANKYAPKPETWCAASLRALRIAGPAHLASGLRYTARDVVRVEVHNA